MTSPILIAARERREVARRQMEALVAQAEARGGGSFNDAEARSFEKYARQVRKDDEKIATLEADEARLEKGYGAVAALGGGSGRRGAYHVTGGLTYGPDLQ